MKNITIHLNELSMQVADKRHYIDDFYYTKCASHVVKVPSSVGHGENYLVHAGNDISLIFTDTTFDRPVNFMAKDTCMCGAIVVLEGSLEIRVKGNKKLDLINSSNAAIFNIEDKDCEFYYPSGRIKMINFSVPYDFILQLTNEKEGAFFDESLIKGCSSHSIAYKDKVWAAPVTPDLLKNIKQIYNNSLDDSVQKLYICGKVMEVLATLYHNYCNKLERYPKIKNNDLKCIMLAAKIIESRMESPPSLLELAKLAGINDNKLKKLFKVVFKKTVYEYLNEKRMQQASDLLLDGHLSVQEVASRVGFKHAGYFSRLFKEKYKKSPLIYKRDCQ